MKASEIITRAINLADLKDSKIATYSDRIESINESYRDLYSRFTESNNDFFMNTVEIDVTPAMLTDLKTYKVPLPADCYKVRTVDISLSGGKWADVEKFPMTSRNSGGLGTPGYRFDGAYLWIIASFMTVTSRIRVRYYPPAARITAPDESIEFALDIPEYSKNLISSPFLINSEKMLYVYDSDDIIDDDLTVGTPVTVYSGTGVTNLFYSHGYVYWLESADIWRAPLQATLTPVNITNTGTILNFSIIRKTIYFWDGVNTNTANLDGSNVSALWAFFSSFVCEASGVLCYLNNTKTLVIDSVTTTTTADELASDGTNLYYRTDFNLYKTDAAQEETNVLSYDTGLIGNYAAGFLAYQSEPGALLAFSAAVDTDLVYPVDFAYEIMEYQSALDFRRKIDGDLTKLQMRLSELWNRFSEMVKRDEYKPERIGNFYRRKGWNV